MHFAAKRIKQPFMHQSRTRFKHLLEFPYNIPLIFYFDEIPVEST